MKKRLSHTVWESTYHIVWFRPVFFQPLYIGFIKSIVLSKNLFFLIITSLFLPIFSTSFQGGLHVILEGTQGMRCRNLGFTISIERENFSL
jgi:hypothetical protein